MKTSEFDDDDGITAIGGLGELLAHVLAEKLYNERVHTAVNTITMAHLLLRHASPEQRKETYEMMARDWSLTGKEPEYPGDAEVERRLRLLDADSFLPAKVEGDKVLIATLFDAALYEEFHCCEHVRASIKERCDAAALLAAKSPDGKEHRAN